MLSLGRFPRGLLGAVALAAVVEAVVAAHDLDLSRPEDVNWRWAHRAARREAPGSDVIGLGTSLVQVAVLPRVVERRTGRPAFNLAVVGAQVPCSYYLLRQAIAAGARPSAVLIDFHPYFLTKPLAASPYGWSDVLETADCLDMAWATGDARFFARVTLERALPSLYHRVQIRLALAAALRGEGLSFRRDNLVYMRDYRRNRGAFVNLKNPNYHGEVKPAYRDSLPRGDWRCDPVKGRYVRRFLDLAAAHGIKVYWLIPPVAPAFQADRERDGVDADYERFVRSFRSYPHLVVIDGRHAGYDAGVFMDAAHLDPDGAFVYSRDVADVLLRDGGARRVALPAYHPRPIDVPLEDMRGSHAALARAAEAAVRR